MMLNQTLTDGDMNKEEKDDYFTRREEKENGDFGVEVCPPGEKTENK